MAEPGEDARCCNIPKLNEEFESFSGAKARVLKFVRVQDSQIFVLISVCRDYLDAILALQDHINDNLDDLNTSRLELNCEGHQSAHYVVQKWKQSFRSIGFIRLPKTGKFHMETGAQNLEWQRNFISSTMVSC